MKQKAQSRIERCGGFAPLIMLIVLAIFGVLIYFVVVSRYYKIPVTLQSPTPTPTLATSVDSTPDPSLIIGWKTYTNPDYGLEMKYPKEFSYKDIGSNHDEITSTKSAVIARSRPEILNRVAFTDSNKNQFTLNFYALSPDQNTNTAITNLVEYSGYCGTQFAERTIVVKVAQVAGLPYKMVSQIDPNGKSLTDFCFFSPKGNLIVLRNVSGSTEIAMKLILSTVKLTN